MRRKVVNFQNRLGSNKTIVALAALFGTDDEAVSFGTDEDVRPSDCEGSLKKSIEGT